MTSPLLQALGTCLNPSNLPPGVSLRDIDPDEQSISDRIADMSRGDLEMALEDAGIDYNPAWSRSALADCVEDCVADGSIDAEEL